MENLKLKALVTLDDVLSKETTGEKVQALIEEGGVIRGYLVTSGQATVFDVPRTPGELLKFLKDLTLGEFIGDMAGEYANEKVLTDDIESVTEAVKTIIQIKKETA